MHKYETWTAAPLLQFLLPTHTLRWTWQHLGWQGKCTPSHVLPQTQSLRLKSGFIKVSHPFSCAKCERDGQSDRSTTICNIVLEPSSQNSGISISRNPGYINIKEKIKCSEKFNKGFVVQSVWIAKLRRADSVGGNSRTSKFTNSTLQLHVQWL